MLQNRKRKRTNKQKHEKVPRAFLIELLLLHSVGWPKLESLLLLFDTCNPKSKLVPRYCIIQVNVATLQPNYLRQHLVFSSSSHAAALESETLFLHPLSSSKCLKLFDTCSSSSSLELQFDVTESYWFPSCNLAKWHSCSWEMSMVLLVLLLEFSKVNGPDLFAGVLWRAGDELLNGVGHLEVVELPRGVISVPISLWCTSWTTSVQASFIVAPAEFLNKNPSLVGSEYLKLGKMASMSSVNLSALTNFKWPL